MTHHGDNIKQMFMTVKSLIIINVSSKPLQSLCQQFGLALILPLRSVATINTCTRTHGSSLNCHKVNLVYYLLENKIVIIVILGLVFVNHRVKLTQ